VSLPGVDRSSVPVSWQIRVEVENLWDTPGVGGFRSAVEQDADRIPHAIKM
jgi:hypothetical protein